MKVGDYIALYGFVYDRCETLIKVGEKEMTVKELFDGSHDDDEINETHIQWFDIEDRFILQRYLKDDYFTPETVVPYLRELFDVYRGNGGHPLVWLHGTFESINLNPDNWKAELRGPIEKALTEWIHNFEKAPYDLLYEHMNYLPQDDKPQTFVDLFVPPHRDAADKYIDVLKNVDPPIISEENEFLLGERSKGAVTAWVTALKKKGIIKQDLPDKTIAILLNSKITKLNLGEDGRTLRNLNTTAYNKYYTSILNLLP